MAGIYDVGDQTSGLPAYQPAPSATANPYDDPAFAKAAYDNMMRGNKPTPGLIGGALSSAVHGIGSQLGGAAQAVGQATGLQGVANWGDATAKSQADAAAAGGRPELEGDWTSPSGVAYNLTKQLPMLAGTVLAARFGGAPVGKLLGVGEEMGGSIAAGASMFPTAVGGNVEAAKAANNGQLSTQDAYKAMALGLPEAAAQAYMPGSLATTLKNGASGDLGKRLLMGGGINALVGAGQGAVTSALTGLMDPNKSIADRAHEMVRDAIGGAIGGGIMGAAIHGLSKEQAPIEKTDPNASTGTLDAATSILDPNMVKVQKPTAEGEGEQGSFVAPGPKPVLDAQGNPVPPDLQGNVAQRSDLTSALPPLPDKGAAPTLDLFTPEETGQRASEVSALRDQIVKDYKVPPNANRTFIDTLQATDQPELIKQIRDQVDYYNDKQKGSMPKWFEKLAKDKGVLSDDGRVIDINKEIAENQSKAEDIHAAAMAKYTDSMGALTAADAQTKQGALKQMQFAKARDALLATAKPYLDMVNRLKPLVDDHAIADTLPDKFARRDAPDTVKANPQAADLWQAMSALADHARTKDMRDRAQAAADSLRRGDTTALGEAAKVKADYEESQRQRMSVKTDNAAPDQRANDNTPALSDFLDKTGKPPEDTVNDNAPYATDAANNNEDLPEPTPGMTNDNQKFGTELGDGTILSPRADDGSRPATTDHASSVRTDEPLTREATNTDVKAVGGERPDVNSVHTDATGPNEAENANRKFGMETTGEYKTDAQIEDERMAAAQKKADAPRNARLLNDNLSGVENFAPRPEALAFARDNGGVRLDEQPPVAMHVIGPANKNQTPKQQAAIEKAKATRIDSAAAKAARPGRVDRAIEATRNAQKTARDVAATKEQARQDKLTDAVNTRRDMLDLINKAKPSGPDILAKMAAPEVKRQGDDDIAHIVSKGVDSTAKVADYLAKNGDSDFVKLLATRFQRMLGKDAPTVSFGSTDDIKRIDPGFETSGLSAAYDEKANHIWLLDRTNLQSNFLHEMVHAVTHATIDKGGPLADRMQGLMDRSVAAAKERGITDQYGHTNLHEFVAEAFSNPEFQKFLASIPSLKPKWSLLDVFKSAISKMLNLPERARSLLDDVLATGSVMMHEHAGQPATPGGVADGNVKAAVFGNYAGDVLQKSKDMLANDGRGSKWLGSAVRATALGWNTFTHIADHYGHLLPSLKSIQNAWEGRDVLQARLHQLHKVARDAYGALPPKAQEAVNTLMGWTRHNIDPRLKWEQQTQFHNMKNADQMRALVKQANDDWNHAKNAVGGTDAAHKAYNLLDASNKSDDYMKSAILAHEYGSSTYGNLNRPEFAVNPGDVFRLDQTGLHNDPMKAMAWWANKLTETTDALTKIKDEIVSPKLEIGTEAEKKTAKSEHDHLSELLSNIEAKKERLRQSPYFHEGRQGDYAVSAKLNLDENKQLIPAQVEALQKHLEEAGFGQYGISRIGHNDTIFIKVKTPDQMASLRDAMAKAQEKGLLNQKEAIVQGKPERTELFNSVAPQYLKRMMEQESNSKAYQLPDDATPEQKAAVAMAKAKRVDELRNQWLDQLGESNLTKAYATRDFAQGWNKDMMHNFVMRSQVAAKSLSTSAMRSAADKAMAQMDQEVQGHKEGADTSKVLAAQQVASEIMRREMERNWHVDTTAVDYIRAVNHTFHLGFSLPYAMEQLSQIPMLLLPELGKTHGFVKSAKAIAQVTPLAFKVMKAVASGPHALDAVITPETLRKHVDAKTADFLMNIVNRAGLDLGSFTREYGVAAKGGEEGATSKMMHMANATAIYSETFGRVLAALSARELHGVDKEGHIEYSKHVLDQSMMSWQPWNTARQTSKTGFLGAYSPLALSFTGYQTRMIEKLYREMHGAFSKDAETAAASRAFLAMHLGAATCIAGTLGMPFMSAFAGAASKLANTLTGKDDYDVEASYRTFLSHTFGKEIGKVIAKGVPQALGLDTSELGDQSLLPFTNFLADRRKLEDRVGDWAKNALGSPFATGLNFVEGARDISQGLPLQGIGKMLPTALKGPYDAYRIAQYGYEDKNGTQKPLDADVRDVLLRVAGLHGATEAEFNDKSRLAAGLKETRMERQGYIKQRLLLSQSHNDPAGYQSAVADAAQFGKDHPLFQPMQSFGTARSRQLAAQARARAYGMPTSMTQKDYMDQGGQLKDW